MFTKQKRVKKSSFSYRITDAHGNEFGFMQDGVIYTFSQNSREFGETWLRMQRTGEHGKDRRRYFLYFADETESCAYVDKYNNVYDNENHYIATLQSPKVIVTLIATLGIVLFFSGFFVFLGGEAIMQTTAPFSDKNTIDISAGNETTDTNKKKPDKVQEQTFDIFGLDDEDETTTKKGVANTTSKTENKDEVTTHKEDAGTTTTTKQVSTNPNGELKTDGLTNKKLIYPGLTGEYQFLVKNSGDTSLYYKMTFSEKNVYEIPMRFKLKKGNDYIVGDAHTWAEIKDLKTNPLKINSGEETVYTIEWKWVELNDAHDTEIGIQALAQYEFGARVDFEEAN